MITAQLLGAIESASRPGGAIAARRAAAPGIRPGDQPPSARVEVATDTAATGDQLGLLVGEPV